jgi:integrase
MVQIMLPYLQIYTVRGRQFAYYRRAGRRIRLRGELGSPEFLAAYQAANDSARPTPAASRAIAEPGSFQALWNAYEQSPEFREIAVETQKDYRRLTAPCLAAHGHRMMAGMRQEWVLAQRDTLAATPSRANRLVAVLRLLVFWGMLRGYRPKDGNPAVRIPLLRTGPGHRPWTEAEVNAFTAPAAGAFALPVLIARYTLQREADIIALTKTAYDGQSITLTQAKSRHTKQPVRLVIPVHPRLKAALDAAPSTDAVTICTRPDGKPWKLHHYKHAFAARRAELGLPDDLHFHGLRATGATALAEMGATPHEIRAFTGHRTLAMVTKYTEAAEQKRLAKSVVTKLRRKHARNKSV